MFANSYFVDFTIAIFTQHSAQIQWEEHKTRLGQCTIGVNVAVNANVNVSANVNQM